MGKNAWTDGPVLSPDHSSIVVPIQCTVYTARKYTPYNNYYSIKGFHPVNVIKNYFIRLSNSLINICFCILNNFLKSVEQDNGSQPLSLHSHQHDGGFGRDTTPFLPTLQESNS